MFPFEQNFVMQFEDGSFLHKGTYHGFIMKDGVVEVGRTTNLKEARLFSSEHDALRVAHDLKIMDSYEMKEIEIIFQLKN